MIVSIHQPNYLTYLGVFYKMARSDAFIFFDDAQYSNEGMHNWNRIKTSQGEMRLKVPVEQHLGDLINEVHTRNELWWKEKHLKALKMNYAKAPHFDEVYSLMRQILYETADTNLASLNVRIITTFARKFRLNCEFYLSSSLDVEGAREEKVIALTKAVGGTVYYSGSGAAVYQDPQHFSEHGIDLVYTDYHPVEYKQMWPKIGFIPNLSVIDYVMNCGFDRRIFE